MHAKQLASLSLQPVKLRLTCWLTAALDSDNCDTCESSEDNLKDESNCVVKPLKPMNRRVKKEIGDFERDQKSANGQIGRNFLLVFLRAMMNVFL